MNNNCKEWFDNIGSNSNLDKEQYTKLVWNEALNSIKNTTPNAQHCSMFPCNGVLSVGCFKHQIRQCFQYK